MNPEHGATQWRVFVRENPIQIDDLGVPPLKPPNGDESLTCVILHGKAASIRCDFGSVPSLKQLGFASDWILKFRPGEVTCSRLQMCFVPHDEDGSQCASAAGEVF